MNPMGGNLAMVRFECEQEPFNRVVAYLQEKPINICIQGPERPHTECSWERFNNQFQEAIECPYNEVCGNMNWDLISIYLGRLSIQLLANVRIYLLSVKFKLKMNIYK